MQSCCRAARGDISNTVFGSLQGFNLASQTQTGILSRTRTPSRDGFNGEFAACYTVTVLAASYEPRKRYLPSLRRLGNGLQNPMPLSQTKADTPGAGWRNNSPVVTRNRILTWKQFAEPEFRRKFDRSASARNSSC